MYGKSVAQIVGLIFIVGRSGNITLHLKPKRRPKKYLLARQLSLIPITMVPVVNTVSKQFIVPSVLIQTGKNAGKSKWTAAP